MSPTPILDGIHSLKDFKAVPSTQLEALASEIRQRLIETVSQNGGHLASNLGVVELTMAIHRVFKSPHDAIVWDVGHQCYVHKLLTGRGDRFDQLRCEGGLSGFPKPSESPHDAFVCGHASTAISAANGIAKAKKLTADNGFVIAVVGDGALTGGLAFEGLANAGRSNDRLIIVLNDNRMSINRNVGYVGRYLATLRALPRYIRMKSKFERVLGGVPLIGKPLVRFISFVKSGIRNSIFRNSIWFEDLGFQYLGPIDGHDLTDLIRALRSAKALAKPVVLHVTTVKGKGYQPAMESPDRFHGVGPFDPVTGKMEPAPYSFSNAFGEIAMKLAEEDSRICLITAAMTSGTGLSAFAEEYPSRLFDVGIAEEHAVTFASGLAKGGAIPIFAVYSTFLQRAYDQLLNDTAIAGNHIVLAVDRAGIVPDDGETHQGIFDVALLQTIPGVTVFAPCTYRELAVFLKRAVYHVGGIAVVRYPKGAQCLTDDDTPPDYQPFTPYIGKSNQTVIVTYGRLFATAREVARVKAQTGRDVSIIRLNQILPIPEEALKLMMAFRHIIVAEEGCGGIATVIGNELMKRGYSGRFRAITVDGMVGTCKVESAMKRFGLDVDGIGAAVDGE